LGVLARSLLIAALTFALCEAPPIRTSANGDITFADVTAHAGLQTHIVYGGTSGNTYILETTGTGVAFLDYDNDGWQDIFLVNGTTLDGFPRGQEPSNHLFRNKHDGTFEEVTVRAGLAQSGWGQGVAVADYDNDGFDDLFVTSWGQNRLYRNKGDGTFEDVTARAGLTSGRRWSTSAAFADYDNDGFVDLYVAEYIDFDPQTAPLPGAKVPGVNCSYRGFPVMCGPRGLKGERDHLYHNSGKGTFTDVTVQAGNLDKDSSRGLGVVWGDINNDGYPDLVVANDAQPNLLYVNQRNGTFRETGLEAGVAVDEDGRERAGMGIDFSDYDNDGWLDLAVANFYGEPHSLYSNQKNGSFLETTWASGIGRATMHHLGWGTRFVDYDNDGWKDLLLVNGHVYPEVDRHQLDETYAEPTVLLRNNGNGTFADVTALVGSSLAGPRAGRGMAAGDYDNDGDLDFLIATVNGPPCLLENRGGNASHWLTVRLIGRRSNRDGIGARVTTIADGVSRMEEVRSGGSYLSQSDLRAHLGLGAASSIAAVEIRWPSGQVDRLTGVPVDRIIVVREGEGSFTFAPGPGNGSRATERR
jgi:hypothetical protein